MSVYSNFREHLENLIFQHFLQENTLLRGLRVELLPKLIEPTFFEDHLELAVWRFSEDYDTSLNWDN